MSFRLSTTTETNKIKISDYHLPLFNVADGWLYNTGTRGGRYLKPPKFEHIFVAVITFPPFLL